MKTERIRSIGILVATLLVGFILGLLTRGVFSKVAGRRDQEKHADRGEHERQRKGDWLVSTIDRVVDPDKEQLEKIKSITSWASVQLDSIEGSANRRAAGILDSVRVRLRPILNDEQWHKFEKFDRKAKDKWGRHDKHH
jgi:hypothetical protein